MKALCALCELLLLTIDLIMTVDTISDSRYSVCVNYFSLLNWLWQLTQYWIQDIMCELLLLTIELIMAVITISEWRYSLLTTSHYWINYDSWHNIGFKILWVNWIEVVYTGYLESDVVSTVFKNLMVRRSSHRASWIRHCINCHYQNGLEKQFTQCLESERKSSLQKSNQIKYCINSHYQYNQIMYQVSLLFLR